MKTVAKKESKTSRDAKPRGTTEPKPLVLPPGIIASREAAIAGTRQLIAVNLIDLSPTKTDRQNATDDELKIPELAQSIAAVGLQQPVLLAQQDNGRFHLIFGERRLRAVRLLGQQSIDSIVRDATIVDPVLDQQLVEARAVENIQRMDPSPIGEALAIADIFEIKLAERIKEHGVSNPKLSVMALLRAEAIARTADRVGKPIAWVRDRMFLAGFSGLARELVSSGRLPLTHAREIAKVADPKRRDELAAEFAIDGTRCPIEDQPGDIETLRREVATSLYSLTQVPWKLDVAFGGRSACTECPHNSLNNPGLFEGKQYFGDDPKHANRIGRSYMDGEMRPEPKAGVCTKPACYTEKTAAANRAVSSAATKVINRYEPAKAAKKSDSAKMLTSAWISGVTPEFVKTSVVSERVNTRLEARAESGKKKPAAAKRRDDDWNSPRAQARREGETKYRNADHNWRDKIAGPALAKYLNAKPARWCMYTMCKKVKAWEKATTWNASPKLWDSPDIGRALKLVDNPSIESFSELEKMCGTNFGLFASERGDNMKSGFVLKVCRILGVEVPEPPEEKPFIAAELAKLKTAEAPGKKPAAKKPAKDEDDDAEEEE